MGNLPYVRISMRLTGTIKDVKVGNNQPSTTILTLRFTGLNLRNFFGFMGFNVLNNEEMWADVNETHPFNPLRRRGDPIIAR